MNATSAKVMILAASLILLVFANGLSGSPAVVAAPPAAITGTPSEPPTNTPVPPPTNTPVSPPTNTPVSPPTSTSVPSSVTSVPPTNTSSPSEPTKTPVVAPATSPPEHKRPDPAVTKTVDQPEAQVGDLIGFTLTVTNRGNATADNVVVNDTLPDYLDLFDVTTSRGTFTVNGRTIVVNVGTVNPGDVVTIRIRAKINDAAPPTGSNTATLTTTSGGDDPSNNTSTVPFIVHRPESKTAPTMTATPVTAPENVTAEPSSVAPVPIVPSPTRRRVVSPATLPRTGAAEDSTIPGGLLVALGLSIAAVSLLLRRRGKR